MSLGLFVERLRRQVDATGPYHGSRLRIDDNLGEVRRVVERLEHPSPSLGREVHIPDRAVTEKQPQHPVTDHHGAYYDRQVVLVHVPKFRAAAGWRAVARFSWRVPS